MKIMGCRDKPLVLNVVIFLNQKKQLKIETAPDVAGVVSATAVGSSSRTSSLRSQFYQTNVQES